MQKISATLLSLALVAFSAYQVNGAEQGAVRGITVHPDTPSGVISGEKIDGEIKMTAALDAMPAENVQIEFVLQSQRYTYRSEAVITADSETEDGLFAASASFGRLPSGVYTVRAEMPEGAALSYMLVEKGGESKYTMEERSVTFYLTEAAPTGSVWFMLEADGGETGGAR